MTTSFDLTASLAQAEATYKQAVADIQRLYAIQQGSSGTVFPSPAPIIDNTVWSTITPNGAAVTLVGRTWQAQSARPDSIQIADINQLKVHAVSGDNDAAFDPARKIRAELSETQRWTAGQVIPFKGSVVIDPNSMIWNSEWNTIFQIHQADSIYSDGRLVVSSPFFSLIMYMKNGKPWLQVSAPTQLGIPQYNVFPLPRILGECPFDFGVQHTFDVQVLDGRGYTGSIVVIVDGKVVANFVGPVGFDYPDLLSNILVNGQPQPKDPYRKVGYYGGKGGGSVPPPDTTIGFQYALIA